MFDAMAHSCIDPRDSPEISGNRPIPKTEDPAQHDLHRQILAAQTKRPLFNGVAGPTMHSLVLIGLESLELLVSAQYMGDIDDNRVDQQFRAVWTDARNCSTEEPTRVHFLKHCISKLDGPTEFQDPRYLSAAQIVIPQTSNVVLRGLFKECRARHLPEDITAKLDDIETSSLTGQEEIAALVSRGFDRPDSPDFSKLD
jgi:hypothetical protein